MDLCLLQEMLVIQVLSSLEMDLATSVQILNEAICISDNINILGKGMNPHILPQAMGK